MNEQKAHKYKFKQLCIRPKNNEKFNDEIERV